MVDFDIKLKRIEEIVEALDKGTGSLDELIKIYEEGMLLTSECREYLDKAELKIQDITNKYKNND